MGRNGRDAENALRQVVWPMIRIALWQAFFLVLPFLLYWGYAVLIAKKKAESGDTWNEAPVTWLLTCGIVLAIASFVYWGLTDVERSADVYWDAESTDDDPAGRPLTPAAQ